jgi:mannose-6-phosphate isomerase-like protein (cupin superfamily)
MLATRQLTSRLLTQASRLPKPAPQTLRLLSTTPVFQGKDPKMSSSPPKHEMVYFPQLTSEVRAFGQFRKVLHTGLFSQLVSMEIPVGGDIGDEVHTVDQVLIFTSGEGKATVAGKDQVSSHSSLIVSQSILTFPTEHQSLRRRRRARWHSAPVHQHV